MQKSMSKTVVVLKTEHSSCFEEAHLILKDKYDWKSPSDTMIEEANRIILQAENKRLLQPAQTTDPRANSHLRWFLAGMFTSLKHLAS